MLKVLYLAGGVAGAIGLSQFPEFSQQYLQRLAGQVDALTVVVADFDDSAVEAGLTRDEAMAQYAGTPFLDERHEDMAATFARLDRLSANLALLRAATPLERLAMPHRFADRELLEDTFADYAPAVPTTTAGAISAGIGYALGWLLLAGLVTLILWPVRRMRGASSSRQRA
ncbi:DUF2937 family protein [Pseudoroseicyclus tamaricis]|uniref:DUF2937 family protein n=1 Tax=Pseudoroseicyclus tamaricis TaxID=2705421 RepID=A0A6B2JWZ1_9RHOB|nr:DUF2937 family protein [Pseudoroseicyclus tamaricis]NDV00744.1 DUF2937 family protein [Pseudoroseicyclus tamaricis]